MSEVIPLRKPEPRGQTLRRILDDARSFIADYVVLTNTDLDALALWVTHTWVFNHYEATPYLVLMSPVARSGKTRGFEAAGKLSHHPMLSSNVSDAVLYNLVDSEQPTLFLDEMDQHKMPSSQKGILNSGYRKGSGVTRMIKGESVKYKTFCPKAFAGIGAAITGPLMDRCIQIHMRRKLPDEHVMRWRESEAEAKAAPIRQRLEQWAETFVHPTKPFTPPGFLNDREAELWEVLLELGRMAGKDWESRALKAAQELTNAAHREEADSAIHLMSDIQRVLTERKWSRFWTSELLVELKALDDGLYSGPALENVKALSMAIGTFYIKSRQIWRNVNGGQNRHGYLASDFADTFRRYVPKG